MKSLIGFGSLVSFSASLHRLTPLSCKIVWQKMSSFNMYWLFVVLVENNVM